MQSKSGVVALIPARGGSKDVPLKNISQLGGKPLIAYSIQTALESESIERVVVLGQYVSPILKLLGQTFGLDQDDLFRSTSECVERGGQTRRGWRRLSS